MDMSTYPMPVAVPLQGGQGTAMADPLAQLRDIHLPGPVESWPPAIGWWILLLIILLLVLTVFNWLYKRWRANRYRREALKELRQLHENYLQHGDDLLYLARFQTLLKRVALTRFSREEVASLTGESWVSFLDRTSRSQEFTMGKGQVLIDGHYSPATKTPATKTPATKTPATKVDVAALQDLGIYWIKHHNPEFAA